MKVLHFDTIDSGFKVQVVLTSNNKLAVRLDNAKGEYVGQIFTSPDRLKDVYRRFSDITLDDKVVEKIVTDFKLETKTNESAGENMVDLERILICTNEEEGTYGEVDPEILGYDFDGQPIYAEDDEGDDDEEIEGCSNESADEVISLSDILLPTRYTPESLAEAFEATATKVVRHGKVALDCPAGFRIHGKQCVKLTAQEVAKLKKAAKKRALKMKGKHRKIKASSKISRAKSIAARQRLGM